MNYHIIKHPTQVKQIYLYRSQNVCSQHPVCVLVAEDLYQSICISVRLGSAVCREWEFAHFIWHTLENKTMCDVF